MKKKILIIAHYYYPDNASTGQILKDQAEGMLDEFDVTVICVVPSYTGKIEEKYKTQKYYFENINGVKVIRIRVPEFQKENKMSRIKNIVSYFFGSIGALRKVGEQDYVFTISQPPVIGGILGVIGKWWKRAKLIYCIQDFNPEQIVAVNYSENKVILKVMMALDKFSCRHSDLVITVGRDLVQTLKNRFRHKNVPKHVMINNWIDETKIYPLEKDNEGVLAFKKKYDLDNKFVIMYSGNIGLYYDLENLIKVIERFKPGTKAADGREVVFSFVGSGAVLDKLVTYAKEHHMSNVKFLPYQDSNELIYSLNAGDVHWVVNSKGIKGVSCPSKFYGVAGVGKPVLGVLEPESEIRMVIEEIGCGLICGPAEYDAVADNIQWFLDKAGTEELENMGCKGHDYLLEHFTKDESIRKYMEAIKAL